jgi:hypothetical protein
MVFKIFLFHFEEFKLVLQLHQVKTNPYFKLTDTGTVQVGSRSVIFVGKESGYSDANRNFILKLPEATSEK